MASQPAPLVIGGQGLDLSTRVSSSAAVTGSPALAAETVVCTLAANQNAIAVASVVFITFNIAYTVGTSGVSARYRVRQGTGTSGSVLYDSGVTTAGVAAAALINESVNAIDTTPTLPGQAYVLTLTIGSGAATSTVSAANGFALFV